MSTTAPNDADLVLKSLTGDREAFRQIVIRYQSLICSLAFSATGSLTQSEDLAQQTFLAAWQQLDRLNEPAKLRAWLCGIARNLTNNALRRRQHEPTHAAETLELARDLPASEPPPHEQAVTAEETALLWRTLERIPEIYREPLILFYREHQSVARVAEALDMSEDTAKQRLSRGRKLLQKEMVTLVEGTLSRTAPGQAFTVGVLAMLPVFDATIRGGAMGVAAAKGATTAKIAAFAAAGTSWIDFVNLLLLAVNFSFWRPNKRRIEARMTDERRKRWRAYHRNSRRLALAFVIVCVALGVWVYFAEPTDLLCLSVLNGLAIAGGLGAFVLGRKYVRGNRAEIAARYPPLMESKPMVSSEYRSAVAVLGLPLVHIVHHRYGGTAAERRAPIKAWIASGPVFGSGPTKIYGVLFASGRVAFAPLCFGLVAVGLLPIGLLSIGALVISAVAVGWWAIGWAAIGRDAIGVLAGGGMAAKGLWAWARSFASGLGAFAPHVDDAMADAYFQGSLFYRGAAGFMQAHGLSYVGIFLGLLVIYYELQARKFRRRYQSLIANSAHHQTPPPETG